MKNKAIGKMKYLQQVLLMMLVWLYLSGQWRKVIR